MSSIWVCRCLQIRSSTVLQLGVIHELYKHIQFNWFGSLKLDLTVGFYSETNKFLSKYAASATLTLMLYDGGSGEDFSKDSIECDERRLTELGRRTIEIFMMWATLSYSKIEVAYQEVVALKRQDELIREEEAAWLAETEKKLRCSTADKEKRSKKKQVH
ncbi:hypothetical protein POM88_042317 [Heracleum sosnowskyi]|uniref:Uncharacterized protein n=1 Tax=Heracleum sosnowskyi TaxID=360622 RepID=A0AAD8HGK4_9APIA|nr:hypothetical protein POM88_042317 [Heracleum sosnowskyi]